MLKERKLGYKCLWDQEKTFRDKNFYKIEEMVYEALINIKKMNLSQIGESKWADLA